MRSKSVLSAVAFIFLFIAAGFAQDFKSEFSVQGTANLPKNSTNIDIPHDATKSGGFLDWLPLSPEFVVRPAGRLRLHARHAEVF